MSEDEVRDRRETGALPTCRRSGERLSLGAAPGTARLGTVHEHLRARLERRAGLEVMPGLEDLRETEWSSAFEALMRNRMVMGAFRYGRLGALGKPDWDRVGRMKRDLAEYEATGNVEALVDVANLAMLEFVEGRRPGRHFRARAAVEHVWAVGEAKAARAAEARDAS